MAMPYYRFMAHTNNSNAEDLGSIEFRIDHRTLFNEERHRDT
jgi:hypothetical protein